MDINHVNTDEFFFIFVNPTSGGNKASVFTKPNVEFLRMNNPNAQVFLYNIKEGLPGQKPGFLRLRNLITVLQERNINKIIRVLVAGGDGTVMWAIEESLLHNISMDHIAIGVIPYGTGNDFSRALKWHGSMMESVFGPTMDSMRSMINEWLNASLGKFDIWEIIVTLHEEGKVFVIDSSSRTKIEKSITLCGESNKRFLKKPMTNYFSVGIESKIGLGFDRHRKKSQLANRITYFTEGLKKICCARPIVIPDIVSSLVELNRPSDVALNPVFRTSDAILNDHRNDIRMNEFTENEIVEREKDVKRDSVGPTQCSVINGNINDRKRTLIANTNTNGDVYCELISNTNSPKRKESAALTQSVQQLGFEERVMNRSIIDEEDETTGLARRVSEIEAAVAKNQSQNATEPNGVARTIFGEGELDLKLVKAASLIAVNIPSFAGGCDIWGNSKGRIGLRTKSGLVPEKLKQLSNLNMDSGDKKLEWITMASALELGLEQIFKGRGMRIDQGCGPYEIRFRDNLDYDSRVYMQIDGEFFQLNKPKSVEIYHSRQVTVLVKKD